MTVRPLRTDRLWLLELGRFQAYLWRDADGVTLTDSGPVNDLAVLGRCLDALGLTPGDVDRVVLTHVHDDHAGGAAYLARHGATVIAHAAEVPYLDGTAPRPAPNFTPEERRLHAQVAAGLEAAPYVAVTVAVADGDELPIGSGAYVVHTPGHTPGSIALHLPHEGVLFTGDTAAEYEGRIVPGVFNLDRELMLRSFATLAGLEARTLCFGHGTPVLDDDGRFARALASLSAPPD